MGKFIRTAIRSSLTALKAPGLCCIALAVFFSLLTGGVAQAQATGTVKAKVLVDGVAWSGTIYVDYALNGAWVYNAGLSVPASIPANVGTYTAIYRSGLPARATLTSITPSGTQTLASGGTITFTLNFAVKQSPAYSGGSEAYSDYYIKNFPYSWTSGTSRTIALYEYIYDGMCPSVSCGNIGSMPVRGPGKSAGFPGQACGTMDAWYYRGTGRTKTHVRPNIGEWTAIYGNGLWGTDTGAYMRSICDGFHSDCALWNWANNVLVADPIAKRWGQCTNWQSYGCAYFDSCAGSLSSNWSGPDFRRIYWGEITPDYYGIAPSPATLNASTWDIVHTGGRALVGGRKALVSAGGALGTGITKGDAIWETQVGSYANVENSFGGGGGPECGKGEVECRTLSSRAKAYRFSDGRWEVMITGYLTGDSLWQNTVDYYTDLANMAGNYSSINSTVIAVQNFLAANGLWASATIIGHSLGAADATVLYNRGYGYQVIGLSPPYNMPYGAMLMRDGRPAFYYSGINDMISNPWCGSIGLNQCRRNYGIPLWDVDTGSGFLTFNNPHDRCKYFWAIGWTCR